jgi:hypothetical protein
MLQAGLPGAQSIGQFGQLVACALHALQARQPPKALRQS